MKKIKYFAVLAIMTLGLAAFTTSCKKNQTCTCTYDSYGYQYSETYNTEDFDVRSCSDLEEALNDADVTGAFDSITCE